VILAWAAVYVIAASIAAAALCRRIPRPAGRRGRAAGAGLGAALGAAAAWLVLVPPSPAPAFEPVGWVQFPFAYLRALRVLRGVSPAEAAWLVERPEVKAVAESESLHRLMRDPEIFREIRRAADGDRLALLALAADPDVKAAMDDPAFLERVRAVDLPDLAKAVESRRADAVETAEADAASEKPGAWRFGYAIGSRLREGIRSLRGERESQENR
jgi:hypothetical protein